MAKPFLVTVAPHLHGGTSVKSVMWNVVVALIPALLAGVYFFGIEALILTCYGVMSAIMTEAIILAFRKKTITISDGSAVVTGLLVSFNVHTGVPWWIPVVGSAFAIAIGKHVFGGLGHNIVNPALLGRVFLVVSWPAIMTGNWQKTVMNSINGLSNQSLLDLPEQITGATPLAVLETLQDTVFIESLGENARVISESLYQEMISFPTLLNTFLGNIGGCIGEISAIALLLGGFYLLSKKIIEWRIPFFYLFTVAVLTYLLGGYDGFMSASYNLPLFHILSGGLLLGALFMATDPVTSPVSKKGRILFGIGCGLITVIIRLYGAYPEGVSFAILIMNLLVPLIDKFTYSRPFGKK
ncbi:MAG: RnfABCDGE type electron transport complex subunit D [Candidatus Cloacimonetes bacterium]|nr:RnfABCDGE type electron transport complex subunit D [Candidatus Cloacimonadota bacterium]